ELAQALDHNRRRHLVEAIGARRVGPDHLGEAEVRRELDILVGAAPHAVVAQELRAPARGTGHQPTVHHLPPGTSLSSPPGSSSSARRSGGQSFSRLNCSNPNAIHTIMPMTATTGIKLTKSHSSMSLYLDQWLRLPVPLCPRLRVACGRPIWDVLPCPSQATPWRAADAQIRLARWQRDRLLALADGGLDALDVAYDARGVAGGDLDQLNWMLAALGGAPLRRDLVEPGRRCIFGEKRAMHAGEHPH